jgi:hypothetical protein
VATDGDSLTRSRARKMAGMIACAVERFCIAAVLLDRSKIKCVFYSAGAREFERYLLN